MNSISLENLLQIFRHRPAQPTPKLLTINIAKCPLIANDYDNLCKQIKQLFSYLFSSEAGKEVDLKKILPFRQRKTAMPVCNKILESREQVYRCFNCMSHEAAVLCINCFENGDHKGHRYVKMNSGGGNCDCGNPDATLPQGFCVNHKGKPENIMVDEKQSFQFNLYMRQIVIWVLKLFKSDLKEESEMLLLHLVILLNELNDQSLYYNQLTNEILFSDSHQMIDHIFVIGSQKTGSLLSKVATDLFLKMFSLQEFKQNISGAFLRGYNNLQKFQHSKFQSLFIQLFANSQLVQKVIANQGISLDPRTRQYNPLSYYGSLLFMGTIKQKSARAFFLPIIQNGGVDYQLMQNIQKDVENGCKPVHQVYVQTMNTENNYYLVQKTIIRLFRDDHTVLQKQIKNQFKLINTYKFKNNRIIISHQRNLTMLIFVYFGFDIFKIDFQQLGKILEIQPTQMIIFFKKIVVCFLTCLGQFAMCIAHMGFDHYKFQTYLNLYTRSGSKIILLDQLGLKVCSVILDGLQTGQFSRTIYELYSSEQKALSQKFPSKQVDDEMNKNKIERVKTIYFLKWVNMMWLLSETLYYDRCQIMTINDLDINDNQKINAMNYNQLKQVLINMKELTIQNVDSLRLYLFNKPLDKKILGELATFDKNKKKFVINSEVTGEPFRIEFMRSLLMTPEINIKKSNSFNQIYINNKISRLRSIFFPNKLLEQMYLSLNEFIQNQPKNYKFKSIVELSHQIKAMNVLFQEENQVVETVINKIMEIASSQQQNTQLMIDVRQIFQSDAVRKNSEGNIIEQTERKALLKKKKMEKMKSIKMKQNLNKFLLQADEKIQENQNEQSCILCHQKNEKSPLCYLGSVYLSNIIYSELKFQGLNPFFQCCFHTIHFQCFIQLSQGRQRIKCPLCKSISNLVLPTQKTLEDQVKNEELINQTLNRLEIILIMEAKSTIDQLIIQISKSFIQLFFSGVADERMFSDKQVKLFNILKELIKIRFNKKNEAEKNDFAEKIKLMGQSFKTQQNNQKYHLGAFIELILALLLNNIAQSQLTIDNMIQICQRCRKLPVNDVVWCLKLSAQLNHSQFDQTTFPILNNFDQQSLSLSKRIQFYQPPKSIRQMLELRTRQQICKSGHNICICVICQWTGCFDCKQTLNHSSQCHNANTLYFSLQTGGFFYCFKDIVEELKSFYSNDTGLPWMSKFKEDDFYFEQDIYKELLQALKGGKILLYITHNFEKLRVKNQSGAMFI